MERYTDTISGEELYTHTLYGNKYYFKDREMKICHRIDGPAYDYINGFKAWYVNGKRHRLDGPAIEYTGGGKVWCVDDVFIMELDKNGQIINRMK